ncbi:MAG: prenyltransferase [Fermentimonas sp.]|jgi:1,4-dihydroxy-2-naphthoate octaprenyltransferase
MDGGGKIKNWILVAQPWAWFASVSPALVAFSYVFYLWKSGLYDMSFNWVYGLIGFVGMIIFHISGNTMNEYQDFVQGVDMKEKRGPRRLIVEGVFKPKTVLYYSLTMLVLGLLIGVFLVVKTGWPLLLIGVVGVLSVLFYHKFKYVALGEVLIYICYSVAVPLGIAYVLSGELLWIVLVVSIPTGLLVVDILHANNARDIVQDKDSGIRTQAMNMGLEGSQIFYQTLILVAYVLVFVMIFLNVLDPLVFVVLLSFPVAIKNIKKAKSASEDNMEPLYFLDGDTAKLSLIFSLLMAVGNFAAPYV